MSYIVPRKKPDRCTNCLFIDKITYDCKLMYGNDYPDFESQYANCPLIEIPTPHGDLVYRDAMKNNMRDWNPSIIAVLDAMPTVIEAEGREE